MLSDNVYLKKYIRDGFTEVSKVRCHLLRLKSGYEVMDGIKNPIDMSREENLDNPGRLCIYPYIPMLSF